jgi:S-adenosylmethionine:tRNA ribosyltransferase-isomerase
MSTPALASARTSFELPPALSATEPPEARGLRRDGVRLLVATARDIEHSDVEHSGVEHDGVEHTRFGDLARHLRPGDLVVVNTSATLPAAVDGRRGNGARTIVHFSTSLDDGTWLVELRTPTGPLRDATAGERVDLPGGAALTLHAGHPGGGPTSERLWQATLTGTTADELMAEHGRPISYGYVTGRWPLLAYQTVFARSGPNGEGSAEMPSAGRPFTHELLTDLVAAGVTLAPITLHTGVSSLEKHEPPLPERYGVPAATARLVNSTRAAGGRIVAVGTTVTRALETVADHDGRVHPGTGWTDLVISTDRPARVVDGLITGWHEPGASHLLLLEAVAGPRLVGAAYAEAVRERYLWHEFGDSCLLLPGKDDR